MNLRIDPFEEADKGSFNYWGWRAERIFMLVPAGAIVMHFMQTMKEFPPRQSPESWTPQAMMEKLRKNMDAMNTAAHPG
jgi:arylsulfatase